MLSVSCHLRGAAVVLVITLLAVVWFFGGTHYTASVSPNGAVDTSGTAATVIVSKNTTLVPGTANPTPTQTTPPTRSEEAPVLPGIARTIWYTWDGELHEHNAEVVESMRGVAVPGLARSLLAAAHEIATMMTKTAYSHGYLAVALGDGRRAAIVRHTFGAGYHWQKEIPAEQCETCVPRLVLESAKQLLRPAVFHLSMHDMDLMGRVVHMAEKRKDLLKPFEPFIEAGLLYFLAPSVTLLPGTMGRIGRNFIPIPHWDATTGSGAMCQLQDVLANATEDAWKGRPQRLFWRGSTTGVLFRRGAQVTRPTADEYLSFVDRGRFVAALFNTSGADVGVTANSQAQLPSRFVLDKATPQEWELRGRWWADVDGNANAFESLRWKLSCGGPVAKVNSTGGFVQWYYPLLQDRVHLRLASLQPTNTIPGDADELKNLMAKLIGDKMAASATSIMSAAARFAEEHLRPEKARHYLRQSILECHSRREELANRDWRIRRPPME